MITVDSMSFGLYCSDSNLCTDCGVIAGAHVLIVGINRS